MRSSRIILSLMTAALMAPISAHALQIKFCMPDCATEGASTFTVSSAPGQTITDLTGVTTTTVPIPAFTFPLDTATFTISATVTSQQSGTLQKISYNPTTVIANAGTLCNGSATNPCRLEIMTTSDPCDFPAAKPIGGYPAGVYMMGSFAGTQVVNNGDTISMTGEASGATSSGTAAACTSSDPALRPTSLIFGTDVINNTPAADPGNIGVSLPSSCTGVTTCKFMATTLRKAFSTQISETVQQTCGESSSCLTRLRTHVNIELKTPGNRVSLPLDHITTNIDPENLEINPTEQLVQKLAPQFGALDVNQLSIFPNDFSVTANVTLAASDSIDPTTEEVFLRVGDFSITVLPGGFKRLANGRMYKFTGKIDDREVVLSFAREGNTNVWKFIGDVHQVQLTGVPHPPLQVPVSIGVGSDIGSDLVAARFYGKQ